MRGQKTASIRGGMLPTVALLFCLAGRGAQAGDIRPESATSSGELTAGDAFASVAFLRSELELIRRETGQPKNLQSEIDVRDAAPREVYFQTLTLFRKSDRLRFEWLHTRSKTTPTVAQRIRIADVFQTIDQALRNVQLVKSHLGISESSERLKPDQSKTPTDVFRSVVQANRQLNLLLTRRFAPSDVFQQVTLAINHTASLLALFPDAERITPEPELQRRKKPADVYRRLLNCFETLRRIATRADIRMLELRVSDEAENEITPSDVYDIASLLVSELDYLNSLASRKPRDFRPYFPGRKIPSQVFQRAGILRGQLDELERFASDSPGRLRGEK